MNLQSTGLTKRRKRSMRLNTSLISSNASKIVSCRFMKLIRRGCSIGKTFTRIQSESHQNSHSLSHPRNIHATNVTRIDRSSCSSYRSTPFHENYRQTLASVEHRSPPFALGTMAWCVHAKLDDESRIWKRPRDKCKHSYKIGETAVKSDQRSGNETKSLNWLRSDEETRATGP